MKTLNSIAEYRKAISTFRSEQKTVGFVPTMGFLHEGHLSLVRECKKENDVVVVSIFVNPTQFGEGEDFGSYPRSLDKDIKLLEAEGVDFLFAPSVGEMYEKGFSTKVSVGGLTEYLCGSSRPGHFDGVALVVTKLLNIIMPDTAYFGMKDYQQLQVIKRFVRDLNMPTNIKGMPIMRDKDGLALSSRNSYLTPSERESALCLNRSFNIVKESLENGEKDAKQIIKLVQNFITGFPYTKIDYIEIVDPETLAPLDRVDKDFLVALAVYVGKARLIDNNIFTVIEC